MTAISGTRRKAQELSDGTLRVMVDIDPRFKAKFHRLFPNIDMPCAIAPLVADFERIEQKEQKGGALSRLAGMWCKDEEFRTWLTNRFDYLGAANTEDHAAESIRALIGIDSRKELDNNPFAGEQFNNMIRIPYSEWLKNK